MKQTGLILKCVNANVRRMMVIAVLAPVVMFLTPAASARETLYNGIQLPTEWPPRDMNPKSRDPMPVPYLKNPPKVIPVDVGRQLFVDDFLIGKTTLQRQFHLAQKYEGNPVLKPETELELNVKGNAMACPKDGGVWWDPQLKCFRMWYEAGWLTTVAYATSTDGLKWERPNLDVYPGTNRILDPNIVPDSWCVVPDYEQKDPYQGWKMYLRSPGGTMAGKCMVSADGVHWTKPILSGTTRDRSSMFYNPFRKKWIFSLRSVVRGRSGHYWEADDFLEGCQWQSFDTSAPDVPVFWTGADNLDPPDPNIGDPAQLYNLNAVAYESLMLGVYEIHRGPANQIGMKTGIPKITELNLAYSRDGFHWDRPDRRAFIPASRTAGTWDRGYVQPVGGICLIRGDKLWFYYSGVAGNPTKLDPKISKNGMYDRGSTGIAFLRRDGFASMNAGQTDGYLTTRPVTFKGKYLFVNVDAKDGELRAEILDKDGNVMPSYTTQNCKPVKVDSTIYQIEWDNDKDLSGFAGSPVKIRFSLKNAKLYAFWVTPDKNGASHGYVGAGGPGFTGLIDTVGNDAYKKDGIK